MNRFLVIFLWRGIVLGGFFAVWQNELLNRGFTQTQIASWVAWQTVLALAVDLPSGTFADWFGHRQTTLLGVGLLVLAFAAPAVWPGTWTYGICILLVGPATSIVNGALQSWAADTQKDQETVLPFVTRDRARTWGMVIGGLSIPMLVSYFRSSPRLAWVLLGVAAIFLYLYALKTPNAHSQSRKPHMREVWTFGALRSLFVSRDHFFIWSGVLLLGMGEGLASIAFWPKLREAGLNQMWMFGVVQALMSLSRLGGLQLWPRFWNVNDASTVGLSVFISSFFYGAFAFADSPAVAVGVWLMRIVGLSIHFSTIEARIVKSHEERTYLATHLSFYSVLNSIGLLISSTCVARFGSDLPLSTQLMGASFCACLGGIVLLKKPTLKGFVPLLGRDVARI